MSELRSPDVFKEGPDSTGTRRLNKRPLVLLGLALVMVMLVLMYTVYVRGQRPDVGSAEGQASKTPASAAGLFDSAPAAGLINAEKPPESPTEVRWSDLKAETVDPTPIDQSSYAKEWEAFRQQQAQYVQERTKTAMNALASTPEVSGFGDRAGVGSAPREAASPASRAAAGSPPGDLLNQISALTNGGLGANGVGADENNAAGKAAWLKTEADPADYLQASRRPPLSPYEVKTGTVIPGVMIGGVNSDLPGQLIAQVRENVYDSSSGQHLLIPQGARLIGTYDNQVTRGQSRVLVAWTRIIYPDGSSLDLGLMPGADQAGYSGFKDKVNNHYVKVFSNAILMSMFAAGIQLSQPESQTAGAYDSQQIAAASLGQQLGQTGMAVIQRNLNIQPTLTVRPGYRFNIMVTKDMILTPWAPPS